MEQQHLISQSREKNVLTEHVYKTGKERGSIDCVNIVFKVNDMANDLIKQMTIDKISRRSYVNRAGFFNSDLCFYFGRIY